MAVREIIGQYADPDFGVLRLIETRTEARVNGGPLKPLVTRSCFGRKDLAAEICVCSSDNPPAVTEDVRTAFRRIVIDLPAFKRTVAETQLEHARDWARQGGLDVPPNVEALTNSLTVTDFSVDSRRLTVWLKETEGIFDGHAIEVRIENREITEILLAG